MRKFRSFRSGAMLATGLLVLGTAHAEMPTGQALAYTCAGCHGTNGVSTGPATPSLAGISKDYMIESMEEYKSGERPATIMTRIAKGYSAEEIVAMSEFFASQEASPAEQSFDAELAAKGAKVHDKYCEKCHEDGGTSVEDDAGLLKGQWRPYLEYSFEDYHSGKREMSKKMAKKFNKMAEKPENMKALLEFYSSK